MFRYRKSLKHYRGQEQAGCPFCSIESQLGIKSTQHSAVIRNIYPYDLWEFREVTDHLLLIPKRHVSSLDHLTKAERADFTDLLAEYEAKNYNLYTRSHISVQKSVPEHLHTHLIATKAAPARFAVYSRRPYWLFRK